MDLSNLYGLLTPGLRAYTNLHYKMKISQGDIVLLLDGVSVDGQLTLQLASLLGAHCLVVAHSVEEEDTILSLGISNIKILLQSGDDLYQAVMEETRGLGVDHIVDCSESALPNRDIIKCLSINGTWITDSPIQLDPPESKMLLYKNASISFLFEPSWTLAPSQLGRLLHILQDLIEKVSKGQLKVLLQKTFPIEDISKAIQFSEKSAQVLVKM